jgi:hypothetical protein
VPLIGVGTAAVLFAYADLVWWAPSINAVLLFARTVDLAGGLSPVPPVASAVAALGAWLLTAGTRADLALRGRTACPVADDGSVVGFEAVLADIRKSDQELREWVDTPLRTLFREHRPVAAAAVLLCAGAALVLAAKFILTVERFPFDWLYFLGTSTTAGLISLSCLEPNKYWKYVHNLRSRLLLLLLLLPLPLPPMSAAYDRLPKPVAAFFGRYLDAQHSRTAQKELLRKQAVHLEKVHRRFQGADIERYQSIAPKSDRGGSKPAMRSAGLSKLPRLIRRLRDFFSGQGGPGRSPRDAPLPPDGDIVLKLLNGLGPGWLRRGVRESFAEPKAGRTDARTGGETPPGDPDGRDAAAAMGADEAAEDFLAIRFVIYTSQFFVQLRQLATGLVLSAVLLLCSVMSYPLEPQRLIALSSALRAAAVVGLVVYLLVQIDRDELVSRVVDTKPNELTWDRAFVANLAKYVAPLAAVLLLNVPVVSESLRSLLEPLLRAVRH